MKSIRILAYDWENYNVRIGFEGESLTCSMDFTFGDIKLLKRVVDFVKSVMTVKVVFDEQEKETEENRSIKITCACGYVNPIPSLEVFHAFDKLKCEGCGRVIAYSER